MKKLIDLIDKLRTEQKLEKEEFLELLKAEKKERAQEPKSRLLSEYLFQQAREVRESHYEDKVFIRGLIEFTNYCKNDCYYCGIRKSNKGIKRYRLNKEEIINCCKVGYELGFRTFVLQGGEDLYFTKDMMVEIISAIKENHPDCAITLSFGEKDRQSYEAFFKAGADRYLLRHETANSEHYNKLHPKAMSCAERKACLQDLKDIGYQVGCGIMVGSPFQTLENLVEDLLFIREFQPHMVGIGPFIPHCQTPFAKEPSGTAEQTLFILGLVRLLLPKVLLPATTALGTIDGEGREKGILAGANVVMPNLSPGNVRGDYALYDNKIYSGAEAAESLELLNKRIEVIGYRTVIERGDFKK